MTRGLWHFCGGFWIGTVFLFCLGMGTPILLGCAVGFTFAAAIVSALEAV